LFGSFEGKGGEGFWDKENLKGRLCLGLMGIEVGIGLSSS